MFRSLTRDLSKSARIGQSMFKTAPKMWFGLGISQASRYYVSRILVAGLLLFAAWGKWQTLATDSDRGDHWWETRPFLVSLVLAELGFGIWLLLGLYPKVAWACAIGLFVEFAVFNGYLFARGEQSCPWLAKLHAHPGLMAGIDLLIVLALACCPPPNNLRVGFGEAPWRLYAVGCLFTAVAIPAFLEMVYYSHRGLALDLQADPRLQVNVKKKTGRVSSEELITVLENSTALRFTIDESLLRDPPDYGIWNMGRAWSVMLGMAEKQRMPARWEKEGAGYHLHPASPLGRPLPWAASMVAFAGLSVGALGFTWRNGKRALLQRFGLHLQPQSARDIHKHHPAT